MLEGSDILSTTRVTSTKRINFWNHALSKVCSGLETDGYGAETLDGRIKLASIDRLKLCDIAASRHRVMLRNGGTDTPRKSTIKIVYQLAGTSIYQQGGMELAVKPGNCIVYDVSRPHTVINPDMSRHLVVAVPKDLALLSDIQFEEVPVLRSMGQNGMSNIVTSLIHSVINESRAIEQDCERGLTESILRILSLSLSQSKDHTPRQPPRSVLNQEIKRLIQKNLRDPELNLDRLAQALSCSKRLLHQSFANEGITISAYLWASRLEKCKYELEAPHMGKRSITDIAFSWGFSSSSHFSRSFKSRFGYAPSATGLVRHIRYAQAD